MFINEENGNRGGKTYAEVAQEEHRRGLRHVAAMESDAGGFVPRGVRMDAEDQAVEIVRSWSELLARTTFTTSEEEVLASTLAP